VILTDREIRISLESKAIEIDPFPSERAFSSTSLDLSLGNELRIYRKQASGLRAVVDPSAPGYSFNSVVDQLTDTVRIDDGHDLEPQKLVLGWTAERVDLKSAARLAARVEGKSSLARLGLVVHMTAPIIHSGFSGRIQLEIVNFGPLPIRLTPGMPVCQLVFEGTLGVPTAGYRGQFAGQGG